jgi:geranylgeranyl diphosphate synthase type I
VDRALESFLGRSQRRFAANVHLETTFDQSAAFVLRGGKRVRPRLCLAAYRILSGQEPSEAVVAVASSLELFHAFMLVHDDLIDHSAVRRGEPALHEALRAQGPESPEGQKASELALIAGDWLFALGLRMVAHSGLEPAVLGKAHRFLSDMLFETGVGEALDVLYDGLGLNELTEPQIVEAYLRKTARYSVSGPLVLGAILAGGSAAVCRILGRFGDLLGLAYQIRNDLDALEGDVAAGCDDLDGSKRTLVLWTAHRNLDRAGRAELLEVLAQPADAGRRERLLELIERSHAVAACHERLALLPQQALAALRHPSLSETQRQALHALASWLGMAAAGISATPSTAS